VDVRMTLSDRPLPQLRTRSAAAAMGGFTVFARAFGDRSDL
jgi:hypothetical protein